MDKTIAIEAKRAALWGTHMQTTSTDNWFSWLAANAQERA